MRISIQTFFSGAEREPLAEFVAGVGRILEARAIAGVWMSEHVVAFTEYDSKYAYPYSDDGTPPALDQVGMLEPLTALAALAMHTKTLRLGTGIAILPQRNPVYFAKAGAAVDILSQGRFIAGVGLGWSAQEYAAVATPFEERAARMEDYVEVIRSLWCDERSKYRGKFYTLPECVHLPKPIRRPHPPFYFGGESAPALRRVAKFGQGWFAFRHMPEQLAPKIQALREALDRQGRSFEEIDVVTSPGVESPCDADMLKRYAELGVSEVVVVCIADNLDAFERQADNIETQLVRAAECLPTPHA